MQKATLTEGVSTADVSPVATSVVESSTDPSADPDTLKGFDI